MLEGFENKLFLNICFYFILGEAQLVSNLLHSSFSSGLGVRALLETICTELYQN